MIEHIATVQNFGLEYITTEQKRSSFAESSQQVPPKSHAFVQVIFGSSLLVGLFL
jgi:hypothetical protein